MVITHKHIKLHIYSLKLVSKICVLDINQKYQVTNYSQYNI